MIYYGVIENIQDNIAWGVLKTNEGGKQQISVPIPTDWHEFNIIIGVDVILYDGDNAKHDDETITPVLMLTNQNKTLILQLNEIKEGVLDVVSGTIVKNLVDGTE